MRKERRCTGCAGPISYPPPISCCATKSSLTGQKALGIKIQFETINANDIQARVTSSIQSGNGPDIIMALNNWPQLYANESCRCQRCDRGDRQAQGGYYDMVKTVGTYGGKWIGVPWAIGGGLVCLSEVMARAKPATKSSR